MNKNIFYVVLLLFFVSIAILVLGDKETTKDKNTLVVAACPTFYYVLDEIKGGEEIETIKTESTSESLDLLMKGTVNLVISGRALKSDEPKFSFEIVGSGYDFIFNKEVAILEEEMQFIPFYTDLFPEKIIADFAFIDNKNLTRTENIYGALDKGIVITVLEDELRGETVHVFKESGERVRLSRLPRLYYLPHFEEEVNFIKEVIKNN